MFDIFFGRYMCGSIVSLILFQVTTVPDEGEDSFRVPKASVVYMASTATRPQAMSQVSTHEILHVRVSNSDENFSSIKKI